MLKELLKLSNHLSRKGLTKEADYLNHAMENYIDEMEESEELMEEELPEDMEEMMPESSEEFEEAVEFAEGDEDELDEESLEMDMEKDFEAGDDGLEISYQGIMTQNLHCCPDTKEALSYIMNIVEGEEEEAIFIDMLESCDDFLGCKEELSSEEPSKPKLMEFLAHSNDIMYSCGMLSAMLNEDLGEKCQVILDHMDDCLTQVLEDEDMEEMEDMSKAEMVAMEEPDLDDEEGEFFEE